MSGVLAVLVLYNTHLGESPAFLALQHFRESHPLPLFVADNSAQAQPLPPDFHGIYQHDGQNAGLAARYNDALARAKEQNAEWLMLLDQDTQLTVEYLAEALAVPARYATQPEVVAVVPHLVSRGRILSPHHPPFPDHPLTTDPASVGPLHPAFWTFNSGALLRVAALEAIGGFPREYWLDYLDHATMYRLKQNGGTVAAMPVSLEHDLHSDAPINAINDARDHSHVQAQARFYRDFATPTERQRFRRWMLREAANRLKHGMLRASVRRLRTALGQIP
ncbi:MAG: glycosyltransferase family 2 protein [Acidobacteriaceae bacterium]|nr:glycosyltransferase family 2 protein [Acidobacteriaceae bacterium]